MLLKRLVQAAVTVVAIAVSVPAFAQQVLKVGSTPTGIPFTFLDTKTNTIEGVMVDLIKEIGKDAGFKVEIEGMQFSTLIPSLTANKIDIIAAAMFITAPRKEVIDFSGPVYTYGERLHLPAKLRMARNYGNPGALDLAGYLASQGIRLTGSARAARVEVLPGFEGSRIGLWRARARRGRPAGCRADHRDVAAR